MELGSCRGFVELGIVALKAVLVHHDFAALGIFGLGQPLLVLPV